MKLSRRIWWSWLSLVTLSHVLQETEGKKSKFGRNICSVVKECEPDCDGRLYYYRANSSEDQMHYAWSTVGHPTLFMSRTPRTDTPCGSDVSIDWNEFVTRQTPGSVQLPGTSDGFSFALVFKSVVEFVVPPKKLPASKAFNVSDLDAYHIFELNNETLTWDNRTEDGIIVGRDENGTILRFEITPRNSEGYEKGYSPKPWFTANSTTFDFTINNFQYDLSTDYSRLALEILLVQGPQVFNSSHRVDQKYSKDDEYTPTVFYTKSYSFGSRDTGNNGFVQWKPITYNNGYRKSSRSQQANEVLPNDTVNADISSVEGNLAGALFGSNYSHAQTIFVVFGTANDNSALNAGMYTWTGSMGYGEQPESSFSQLVIMVIIVGLGIPAVLTLMAILFVVSLTIRKYLRGRAGYKKIK